MQVLVNPRLPLLNPALEMRLCVLCDKGVALIRQARSGKTVAGGAFRWIVAVRVSRNGVKVVIVSISGYVAKRRRDCRNMTNTSGRAPLAFAFLVYDWHVIQSEALTIHAVPAMLTLAGVVRAAGTCPSYHRSPIMDKVKSGNAVRNAVMYCLKASMPMRSSLGGL